VISSPAILSEPGVAEALGMPELAAAQASAVEEESTPELPPGQSRTLPDTQNAEPEPEQVPDGLTAAAELLVFDALSRAGGRLLTRENRGQFANVPKHELHTVLQMSPFDAERLMEGAFQFSDPIAHAFGLDPATFRYQLEHYVAGRLNDRIPHNRNVLRKYLR